MEKENKNKNNKKPKKLELPPRGAYCTHQRMQYASCGNCPFNCMVKCPDCSLTWMFNEGVLG